MSGRIIINSRFLTPSLAKQLWYVIAPARTPEKQMQRLEKRGVVKIELEGVEPAAREKIFESIITNIPAKALDTLFSNGISVECADFKMSDAYRDEGMQLLNFALAGAMARQSAAEIGPNTNCEKNTKRMIAENLIKWPFYIGGIAFLDIFLLPEMISYSDALLSSRYFDYIEAAPLAVDLGLGMGVWMKAENDEAARKLEPYKYLPLPLAGYLLGRCVKKILWYSGRVSFKAATILYSTLARYFRLRLYESNRETADGEKTLADYKFSAEWWSEQRALIGRWLKKGKIEKAQALFRSVIKQAASEYKEEKPQVSYILNSFGNEELKKLFESMPTEDIFQVVRLISDKEEALRLFSVVEFEKWGRILYPQAVKKEIKQALLGIFPAQGMARLFEEVDPKKGAEIFPLLPENTSDGKPSAKIVLNGISAEMALEIFKAMEDANSMRSVYMPMLKAETRLEMLDRLLSSKGPRDELVKALLDSLLDSSHIEAAVKMFEQVDPKRAADLLVYLYPDKMDFRRSVMLSVTLKDVFRKMEEGRALSILREIKHAALLKDVFSSFEGPAPKILILEQLPPDEAAKMFSAGSKQWTASPAVAVGIKRETALKILSELELKNDKIEFVKRYCGNNKEEIFKFLIEYVCEDGLRLLSLFSDEYFGEKTLADKKRYDPEIARGFSDSEIRRFTAFEEMRYLGLPGNFMDKYYQFIALMDKDEFRTHMLINQSVGNIVFASTQASPMQLVRLAEDYARGNLPEGLEMIFNLRSAEDLSLILKAIRPAHLKKAILDRLNPVKSREILSLQLKSEK